MSTVSSRLPWLAGLMALSFLALEARLTTLHLNDTVSAVAVDNALRTQRLDAPRGRILDRRGEVLADVRPTIDLRVRPRYVQDKEALRLALMPRLSEAELERYDDAMLAEGWDARRAWVIAPDLDRATRAWVSGNRPFLAGVDLAASQQREYPLGGIAPHAMGYVAEVTADDLLRLDRGRYRAGDYTGRQGIERLLEDELHGVPGVDATLTTSVGGHARGSGPWFDRLTTLANNWDVPVRGGGDITLTLDQNLQAVAEAAMDDRRGAVVMMDVNSGAVLAYVSSPDFEPGELVDGISRSQWRDLIGNPANPLMDRVSRGLYPPASTFKMVTAAAALEAGVSENHTVRCTGGYRVGNRRFKCWKR
ncbi:MAG: penicillin-binding protein 2, partial [Myxococcota bacterium]